MKYVLLFLISFPLWADVLPPNELVDQTTIHRIDKRIILESPNVFCIGVDVDKYTLIPETKTDLRLFLAQTILTSQPCYYSPDWRVYTGNNCGPTRDQNCTTAPLKDVTGSTIGRVEENTLCDTDKYQDANGIFKDLTGGLEWHFTANLKGQRGLARCQKK